MTCIQLERVLSAESEGQMRALGILSLRVPAGAADVLAWAFRAVRARHGDDLCDATCLLLIAWHFVETWKDDPMVQRSLTRSQRIFARDLGRCQTPGCSRRGVHAHHLVFQSRGGTDDEGNLIILCGYHHLVGIHGGFMAVEGVAPDRVVWTVAGRPFRAGAQDHGSGVQRATS